MKSYIKSLIENGQRVDGRKLTDVRDIVITNDVSTKAEGSARVKWGDTEVIAGVKMSVGTPYSDSPDKGTLMVTSELLPMANENFSAGPPSIESIELARVIDRGIRESNMIDLKKLCIKEGEAVWTVFVDLYIINDAGNILDAAALAAVAALKDSLVPTLEEGNKVDYDTPTKNKLPLIEDRIPLTSTIFKSGDKLFVDPVLEETSEVDARVTIGISASGDINAMQKGGAGFFTIDEVNEAVKMAKVVTDSLRKKLK